MALRRISFQGEPGAYGHQACREMCPDAEVVPCVGFQDAIDAVHDGRADMAMLPVENSTYGRVADIHQLLPESGLYINGEHFVRVRANLLGVPGARLGDIKVARTHQVLLGQVRGFLRTHGIRGEASIDTAGSARLVAEAGERSVGALSSELAGEIYGLELLARGVEDAGHNTTRFLLCGPKMERGQADYVITSFIFQVRNIPAALYKAMGGFATNGVNMVKLESYMVAGSFTATQFYADIEGPLDDPAVERALEELRYFTSEMKILGSYPADRVRRTRV